MEQLSLRIKILQHINKYQLYIYNKKKEMIKLKYLLESSDEEILPMDIKEALDFRTWFWNTLPYDASESGISGKEISFSTLKALYAGDTNFKLAFKSYWGDWVDHPSGYKNYIKNGGTENPKVKEREAKQKKGDSNIIQSEYLVAYNFIMNNKIITLGSIALLLIGASWVTSRGYKIITKIPGKTGDLARWLKSTSKAAIETKLNHNEIIKLQKNNQTLNDWIASTIKADIDLTKQQVALLKSKNNLTDKQVDDLTEALTSTAVQDKLKLELFKAARNRAILDPTFPMTQFLELLTTKQRATWEAALIKKRAEVQKAIQRQNAANKTTSKFTGGRKN